MRTVAKSALSLILVLVFTSMGVLALSGDPIIYAADNPLGITADAADACCCSMTDMTCQCCTTEDEASSCCSDQDQDCARTSHVQGSAQLTAYLTLQESWMNPADSSALTTIPDQRPEDALALSIDHVPKHSLS